MSVQESIPDVETSWYIKKSDVTIREEIGKGAFGTVYKGLSVSCAPCDVLRGLSWY